MIDSLLFSSFHIYLFVHVFYYIWSFFFLSFFHCLQFQNGIVHLTHFFSLLCDVYLLFLPSFRFNDGASAAEIVRVICDVTLDIMTQAKNRQLESRFRSSPRSVLDSDANLPFAEA